jgi:hypothetical protein
MAHMTPAEFEAIKNPLPGGAAFNGKYWWLDKTASGVAAVHDADANTFGAVMEHDQQISPGVYSTTVRCSVEIIAKNRATDVGFYGNNTIVVNGFQDPITCPVCGLSGSLQNKTWVTA